MLYWDVDRQISVAMISNNALAPSLQQRLQRALVAFAQAEMETARAELTTPLADLQVPVGQFKLSSGEVVEVVASGQRRSVRRGGVDYPAYLIGSGIRYVPGLDLYIAGGVNGGLQWLSLYEDLQATTASNRK